MRLNLSQEDQQARMKDGHKAQQHEAHSNSTKDSVEKTKSKRELVKKNTAAKKMGIIKNSIWKQKKAKAIKIAESLISEESWRYPVHKQTKKLTQLQNLVKNST